MKINQRVRVVRDNEGGGGDEWAINLVGVVTDVDEDDYCEVRLDGRGQDTFQFGAYQLEAIN